MLRRTAPEDPIVLSSSSSEDGGGGGGGGRGGVEEVGQETKSVTSRVRSVSKSKSRLNSNKTEMTKKKNKPPPEEEDDMIVDVVGKIAKEGKKRERDAPVSVSSSSSSQVAAVANSARGIKPSFSSSCSFPMSRVRRLIVGAEGTNRRATCNMRTTHDAVFLVNKAAELFLELFADDAYVCAMREHKKSISYDHLSSTVYNGRRYEFLSDFVPEKLRAEDALKVKGTN